MVRKLSYFIAAALAVAPFVHADQPAPADMQKKIEQLEDKVRQLESRPAGIPYTARDVDNAIESVMKDADRRSQLLAEAGGFYGGWMDDKFVIRSADGNWSMSPGIQFQYRYVTNINTDVDNGSDNTDSGFETRRLKFSLEGSAITKNLTYTFVWATDRKSGNLVNEEAFAKYKFADAWAIKGGQLKQNTYQESTVSSKRQLAVDRSMADEFLFGGDIFSQAVELNYETECVQALIGYSDGFQSKNTNFQDPSDPTGNLTTPNSSNFGVYARLQYKVFGDWKSYQDFTSMGNKKDLLVFAAAMDWTQQGDSNIIRHVFDVQYETGPIGLFGAFVGRYNDKGSSDDIWDWAALIQAGYMLNKQWELFARYDLLEVDGRPDDSESTFHEITLGVNYFIYKHTKVTVDFLWLPSGAPSNIDSIGILANDGEAEYVFRAQFQLLL